jgi:Big-like domain-containing protein
LMGMQISERHFGSTGRVATLMAALAAVGYSLGCGGDDLKCNGPFCVSPPEHPEPSSIQPGPNNGQQGVPGRELPESIDVKVTDSDDRPVSGVTVNFSVSSGGGTLSDGTGESSNATAESNSDGLARVSWKLGRDLGTQTLEATATNGDGGQLNNSPLELSAEAVQPQPARIVLRTTLSETAQNGVPLEQQPVIEVYDAEDQPVPQVEVVASVSSGGATLNGATSVSSDASGLATFTNLALAGLQGPQTLQFSVASSPAINVASGPVQLTAGEPAALTSVAPLTYEGTVNSPVSPGPSVVVQDAAGNGVAGVAVSFTPNRNGSVSPETATTNEQGVAQVSWTLGSTANVNYSLTARIESSSIAPVQFSAVARPGAAGRLRISVQPSSPTQSGTPFAQQPVIQVVDQEGNPTPQAGVIVTAAISSGPTGSLQNTTATTDGTGQAAFSGLALTGVVGNYTLSFSAPGLGGVPSNPFTITVGSAAQLVVITQPSTLARSRFPVVTQPVVQVQDPSGNPIRQTGVVVTAAVTTPMTSLTGETATTDDNGRAQFTTLTIIGIPGPKNLTFSAPGLQSAAARVTLRSVETVTATPSHPVSAVVGTMVAGQVITWTLRNSSEQTVADADFTLLLPQGGTTDPVPQLSDANGAVRVSNWTLGPTAGYQYLVLRLPDGRTFPDSILATPDVAADLVKVSGDNPIQSAPTESQLPQPFVVRVVDRFGNGVGDIPVQWSTCDGVAGPTVNTDGNGYSSVTQPTGTQPSGDTPFCTRAAATIGAPPPRTVDFQYLVTGSAGSNPPAQPGVSGAAARHSGPPPVAPKSRLRPSR